MLLERVFSSEVGTCFCRSFVIPAAATFQLGRSSWDKIARIRSRLRELKGDMNTKELYVGEGRKVVTLEPVPYQGREEYTWA